MTQEEDARRPASAERGAPMARPRRRAVLAGAASLGLVAMTSTRASAATLDVTSYGAFNDGTHPDETTVAIKSAIAAAATDDVVSFPAGTYAVNKPLVIGTGAILQGSGGATIEVVGAMGNFITLNANKGRVWDLTFSDPDGMATGAFIIAPPGYRGSTVLRCTFDTPQASIATHLKTHSFGVVSDNTYLAAKTAIQITGGCTTIRASRNTITNWMVRGIEVDGDATGACTDLILDGNQISELRPGGASRYPIQINQATSATLHTQLQVSNNVITGPDRGYFDPSVPGSADQIEMQGCSNFEVFGNRSFYGGDGGIVITLGSNNGTVHDNICRYNDTTGVAVQNQCHDVQVYNNECTDNGQNRMGDRPTTSRNGISAHTLTGAVSVTGNTCGDNQATKTQQYGVVWDEYVTYSDNDDGGYPNALAFYQQY